MHKEKKITIEVALNKMEVYCSQAEHCSFDVYEKLKSYDLNNEQVEEIVKTLREETSTTTDIVAILQTTNSNITIGDVLKYTKPYAKKVWKKIALKTHYSKLTKKNI